MASDRVGAAPDGAAEPATDHLTTSTRDQAELGRRIEAWLVGVVPPGGDPRVTDVVKPEGNGMSSETLLFTASWIDEDGTPVERQCVARIEPELDKIPVFPSYDLAMQYQVMELVGEATDVPVPEMLWFVADGEVIGAPFFVMARVDGEVPRDVMPYTFGDNWLDAAAPAERARLQHSAVAALAGIHRITPTTHDLSFLPDFAASLDQPVVPSAGTTALDLHLAGWERYLEWVAADERSPLLDDCFAWLRDNLPTTTDARLSWGDARIGNMLFVDFETTAVLDWEMAGIAPPEVDLGWMTYLHCFFQDIALDLGVPGFPDLFRPVDVVAAYAALTGYEPGDLTWYIAYAAMRHGVIMRRVTERAVLFGEAVRPPDPDDMILHRDTLRQMLAGTYWSKLAL